MEMQMDDSFKVWTTVGSAGTLDQADLAKVHLFLSIVQLGVDFGSTEGATAAARAIFPTTQAVVRYNVTPVEGLFFLANRFKYLLQIRFRGHITAKLMQVNIETGAETQLILFDSNSFPPKSGFQLQQVAAPHDSPLLDFVNNGYYVEATLITSAIVIGDPSAISVIKLVASPDFPG
jgi:hypothetical protein